MSQRPFDSPSIFVPSQTVAQQAGLPQTQEAPIPGVTPSTIDRLLGMINPKPSNPVADIGSVLGSFSQGEKANRMVEGNFRGDFDDMMLRREQSKNELGASMENDRNQTGLQAQTGRNQNEADALKKLQQTAYIKGGGSSFSPASISLGGQQRQLPSFAGLAPRGMSSEEIQGATDLQGQVMSRLQPGGSFTPSTAFTPTDSYKPTPVDEYAKPGMAEKISSYGGAGAGIIGSLMEGFGGAQKVGGLLSGGGANAAATGAGGAAGGLLSNVMGKAVPIAGAVTGGIGLMKDRGTKANIMNGVTTGASLGSMVAPGIGTAVGAGIGALGGWARGLGGASETEIQGRELATQGRQAITTGATPQQQAEAQGAGWKNPQDALTMIVIRDKVVQAGGSPEQANALMKQLYQAEKGGPQAVEQVLNQIMSLAGPTGGQV